MPTCADGFFVEFFSDEDAAALAPALTFTEEDGLTLFARPNLAAEPGAAFEPADMILTVTLEVDCGGAESLVGYFMPCYDEAIPDGPGIARQIITFTGDDPAEINFPAEDVAALFAADSPVTFVHLIGVYASDPGAPPFRTSSYSPVSQALFAYDDQADADTLDHSGLWQPVAIASGAASADPGSGGDPIASTIAETCSAAQVLDCDNEGALFGVPLLMGDTICTVYVADPNGDYTRFYLYSDLDGDGATDLEELSGAEGDGNVLTCVEAGSNDTDSDNDGLTDGEEDADGDFVIDEDETDPQTADTDGDGLNDCQETGYVANSPDLGEDTDSSRECAAGLKLYHTSARDEDSDIDGLLDGEEVAQGGSALAAVPEPFRTGLQGVLDFLCVDPRTFESVGSFPSCLRGAAATTVTNPTDSDTDDDGITDGVEDANQDGVKDAGESDPTLADTDGDKLADGVEDANQNGIQDATETSADSADTDGDSLSDCQETGYVAGSPALGEDTTSTRDCGTGVKKYHTDPLDNDSDGDGGLDGDEVDTEHNPTDADDVPLEGDTDGDGISDEQENTQGTDPNDPDTDADGLSDCQETGYVEDSDPATDSVACPDPAAPFADPTGFFFPTLPSYKTDPLVADSDSDDVTDGAEIAGSYASDFNGDGDPVAAPTNPTDDDSDDDSLIDGDEVGTAGTPGALGGRPWAGSPTDPDSDDDSVPDNVEVRDFRVGHHAQRSLPNDKDSDDDGLSDCQETGFVAQGAGSSGFNDLEGLYSCVPLNVITLTPEHTSRTQPFFTNPLSVDSDGDTLRDCQEQRYEAESVATIAPFEVQVDGDVADVPSKVQCLPFVTVVHDHDGTAETHYYEPGHYRTNPARADSDSEGDDDGYELTRGTNPTDIDTDGDGFTDCQEVGYIPNAEPFTTTTDGNVCASADAPGRMPMADGGLEKGGLTEPVHYTTSPTSTDSDGDGTAGALDVASGRRTDSDEALNFFVNGFAMNPTQYNFNDAGADSDGDDLMNCQENGFFARGDAPNNVADVAGITDSFNTGENPGAATCRDVDGTAHPTTIDYFTNPRDPDSDGDRIGDHAEVFGDTAFGSRLAAATNPSATDTDADTLGDCIELGLQTGLVTKTYADAAGSPECDGLTTVGGDNPDPEEPDQFYTDPQASDSDADGVADNLELSTDTWYNGATDPTNSDSDNDGLLDCQETTAAADADPFGFTGPAVPQADPYTDGNCTAGGETLTRYKTDPTLDDSDGDLEAENGGNDGEEVLAATNPTVSGAPPPQDIACGRVGSPAGYENCAAVLAAVRVPDPTQVLLNPECNFMNPTSWDVPVGLWDGEACNDLDLAAYLGAVLGSDPTNPDTINDLAAGLLDDAYGNVFLDRLDPADIDEDGITEEPNGQPDVVEQQLLIVDPHGPDVPLFPIDSMEQDDVYTNGMTSNLPETVNGVTIILRNAARGGQLLATMSVYNTGQVIVEVFNGADIQSVCFDPMGDNPVGLAPGRYDDETCATSAQGQVDDAVDTVCAPLDGACDSPDQIPTIVLEILCEGPLEGQPVCEPVCDPMDPECAPVPSDPCDVSGDLPGCGEPPCDPDTDPECPEPEPCDAETDPTCDPAGVPQMVVDQICGMQPTLPFCGDGGVPAPPGSPCDGEETGRVGPLLICTNDGGPITGTLGLPGVHIEIFNVPVDI
ncbi:MAG: hypothetical protein AABY18_03285 [Candidatus Thermoplasmatota archaeon]